MEPKNRAERNPNHSIHPTFEKSKPTPSKYVFKTIKYLPFIYLNPVPSTQHSWFSWVLLLLLPRPVPCYTSVVVKCFYMPCCMVQGSRCSHWCCTWVVALLWNLNRCYRCSGKMGDLMRKEGYTLYLPGTHIGGGPLFLLEVWPCFGGLTFKMEVGDIMWKLHRTSAPKARLYSIFLHIGWCVWVKAFFMVLSLRKTWRSLGNWVHQLDPIGSIEKLYFYDYKSIVCFTFWACHKKICQVPWRIGIFLKYFYGRMTLGWFTKCAKFLVGNFWKNAGASCLSMFSRRMHSNFHTHTYIHCINISVHILLTLDKITRCILSLYSYPPDVCLSTPRHDDHLLNLVPLVPCVSQSMSGWIPPLVRKPGIHPSGTEICLRKTTVSALRFLPDGYFGYCPQDMTSCDTRPAVPKTGSWVAVLPVAGRRWLHFNSLLTSLFLKP